MVSVSLILAAFYLAARSIYEKIIVGSFLLISIIDIGHYWLWYKRNEIVISIEGTIVLCAAVLMFVKFRHGDEKTP